MSLGNVQNVNDIVVILECDICVMQCDGEYCLCLLCYKEYCLQIANTGFVATNTDFCDNEYCFCDNEYCFCDNEYCFCDK